MAKLRYKFCKSRSYLVNLLISTKKSGYLPNRSDVRYTVLPRLLTKSSCVEGRPSRHLVFTDLNEELNPMSCIYRVFLVLLLTINLIFLSVLPANAVTISATTDSDGHELLLLVPSPAESEGFVPELDQDRRCKYKDLTKVNGDFEIMRHTQCKTISKEKFEELKNDPNAPKDTLRPLGDGGNEDTVWDFDFKGLSFLSDNDEQIRSATLIVKGLKSDGVPRSEFNGNENLFIPDLTPIAATTPNVNQNELAYSSLYAIPIDTDESVQGNDAIKFDLLVTYNRKDILNKLREGTLPFKYFDDALIMSAQLEIAIDGSVEFNLESCMEE